MKKIINNKRIKRRRKYFRLNRVNSEIVIFIGNF